MKFGPVPVAESAGGIVAHAVRRDGIVLKKGERVGAAEIAALEAAHIDEIVVAQLEPGDVNEDEAARRLALAVVGDNLHVDRPFTGRANIFATVPGVLMVSPDAVDRINSVDETVTLATLPPYRTVVAGEMVATVKIIPFAVHRSVLERAVTQADAGQLAVAAFMPLRVGVVSTLLPSLKTSVVDKTIKVMAERLAPAGARIVAEKRVPHDAAALTAAIASIEPDCDLLVIFGASAITDRRDVIPAAIEGAGGTIEHLGMPVDPGNLLLIGRLHGAAGGKVVLGAPGCARSPKENGFDWVIHRLLAKIPVTSADIRRMGAGGLLMEIVARGQLRFGKSGGEIDEAGLAAPADEEAMASGD